VEEIGPVGIAFLEFSINHAVLRFHTQETDASDETGVTSVGCAQNKRSGTPCGAPAGEDAVLLKGWFVLGQDSDGIDPLTEDITVTVGSYQLTIPAGSFTQKRGYRYQGILAGAEVFAWLREQGHDEYTFLLKIKDVDLAGSANPVTIGLAIGNDSGAREQRLQGVLRTHRPGKSKR
jgi:hypothetical protein